MPVTMLQTCRMGVDIFVRLGEESASCQNDLKCLVAVFTVYLSIDRRLTSWSLEGMKCNGTPDNATRSGSVGEKT